MSNLEARFEEAVDYIQNGQGEERPSNQLKLEFYALYKQATEGDVTGKRPGMTDFIARAKYDVREPLRGVSREDAMQRYLDRLEEFRK